jgi:hypothetical protein
MGVPANFTAAGQTTERHEAVHYGTLALCMDT